MNTLIVDKAQLDPAELRGKPPSLDGLKELPVNTLVTNAEGQPLVAYMQLYEPGDPALARLRAGLLRLHFAESQRVNGLAVRALSFGYLPRIPLRSDFCRPAIVVREHPELVADLVALAGELEARYAEVAAETFAYHAEQAARVLEEWRLPAAQLFTGGTINRDNAIGYHQDRGNFKATFSAMPVVRQGMGGGALVVPELGVYLPVADGTVTYFDGQDLWHAVTPLKKLARDAHRFSIVYYSLSMLWHCLPPAGEVERHQVLRTEREERRRRDPTLHLPAAERKRIESLKEGSTS